MASVDGYVNTNKGGASLTPEQISASRLSQGVTPLLSQLLSKVSNGDGWNEFVTNPKGFLGDVSKVSKYSPELGQLATSDPSSYSKAFDQYLKGTNRGTAPGVGFQYEGDSSYYKPLMANGSWYDYKGNAFRGIGDGYGVSTPSGAGAPTTTIPTDTTPVTKKPKPKGEEYNYGKKNPYLDTLLGMGQASKDKTPHPWGSASFRQNQPLKPGEYQNFKMLRTLMGG